MLVSAALALPAFSVSALAVALVVLTDCETVKSPLVVDTSTTPLADTPLVAPTVPSVRAAPLTNVSPLTPVAAKVPIALLLLSSVTLPPESSNLLADNAPPTPSLTVPELLKLMVLPPVAVSAALMAKSPPIRLIGPAMLMAFGIMMPALLPTLPTVRPLRVFARFQSVVLKADVKLLLAGWIVKLPVPSKPLELVLGASFCHTRLPLLIWVPPL